MAPQAGRIATQACLSLPQPGITSKTGIKQGTSASRSGKTTPLLAGILFLSILLLTVQPTAAQRAPSDTTSRAFSTSTISMAVTAGSGSRMLESQWRVGTGGALSWSTPFYLGDLELQAVLIPLYSQTPEVPNVNNLLTTLGWSIPAEPFRGVQVSAGFMFGNNFMYRPSTGPLEGPESEFAAGLSADLRVRITDTLWFRTALRQVRVYTYHRMNLTQLQAGLQIQFTSPGWLVQILE